ncbi:hypothetical protein NMY22_g7503 [Coprinellus aureogranulatus]|nr:hypothetical protein NMY22_g7503 [Coprinellus aureogranulatus]
MPEAMRKGAKPHYSAACWLTPLKREKVWDAISQTAKALPKLTESFQPCAEEAAPGTRLMDLYADQVDFNVFNKRRENALDVRHTELNTIWNSARVRHDALLIGTDSSVPMDKHFKWSRPTAGKASTIASLSRDVSWLAASSLQMWSSLLFDSIAMARRAVDPSVHSGQMHSLAVCKALTTWFSGHPERSVSFVETPSKLKWGIHYRAHQHATGLAPVRSGGHPATSLDSVRKDAADSALDRWTTMSRDPDYRGHQFLVLRDLKGKPLPPRMCARFCRAVLNHAPIGEYYVRFNIPEDPECECGCPVQTRRHIFVQCGVLTTGNRDPKDIRELVGFLVTNPTALGFNRPPAGVG